MTSRPSGTCSNPDCTFNDGGACVDGFPDVEIAEKCSNFSEGESEQKLDDIVQEPEDSSSQKKPDQSTTLPSGDALQPMDLYNITRGRDAKVILLGGPIESGKTTLIVSIYEKFRQGRFAEHFFSGSETLIGFEKRCHASRAASGRTEAHTERTLTGSKDILHLQLASETDLTKKIDLLLVDVSGEIYEAALNFDEEVNNIPLLRQADYFTYVFDGNKLAHKRQRQAIKNKGLGIIRTLTDNGALNEHSNVQVVFSKQDVWEQEAQETEQFIQEIISAINKSYNGKYNSLTYSKVAARPQENTTEAAHGVDGLIKEWVALREQTKFSIDYAEYIPRDVVPFDGFARSLVKTGVSKDG